MNHCSEIFSGPEPLFNARDTLPIDAGVRSQFTTSAVGDCLRWANGRHESLIRHHIAVETGPQYAAQRQNLTCMNHAINLTAENGKRLALCLGRAVKHVSKPPPDGAHQGTRLANQRARQRSRGGRPRQSLIRQGTKRARLAQRLLGTSVATISSRRFERSLRHGHRDKSSSDGR